jgi:hypothetical protein
MSARYDLRTKEMTYRAPIFSGATDAKIIDVNLLKNNLFDIVVGPVSGGASQIPKFNFSKVEEEQKKLNISKPKPIGVHVVLPGVWISLHYNGDPEASTAAVVCSIIIPFIAIGVGMAIWGYIYHTNTKKLIRQ